MRIEFEVDGRPPRKHGEKSMWARADEAPLVAKLRTRALEARAKGGLSVCPHVESLELEVYAPRSKLEGVGDLDSFIAGVCDGLQAADRSVIPHLHPVFAEPDNETIHPRHSLLIENDSKITLILARKVPAQPSRGVFYKVAVATSE